MKVKEKQTSREQRETFAKLGRKKELGQSLHRFSLSLSLTPFSLIHKFCSRQGRKLYNYTDLHSGWSACVN